MAKVRSQVGRAATSVEQVVKQAVVVEWIVDGETYGGLLRSDLVQALANDEGHPIRVYDVVTDELLRTVEPSK